MRQISQCGRCNKPDNHPFNLLSGGCKCTPDELKKHSDEQYNEMERSFNGRHSCVGPSVLECKRVLESNGYKVVKKSKNKDKRKRKNRN